MSEHILVEGGDQGVPVNTFRSASLNKDPLIYPGDRPAGSFITDGTTVYTLQVTNSQGNLDFAVQAEHGQQDIDEYLASCDAAPLAERYPVLSYGANMSPGSLKSKFSKAERSDLLVVPTVYSQLSGHDVVWSGGPGVNGNFIACLYSGPEVTDTNVQVGVSYLTVEQLLMMHATELNYDLGSLHIDIAGVEKPVYYYSGKDTVYVHADQPVAVESIPATDRALQTASTTSMLDIMLAEPAVQSFLQSKTADSAQIPQTARTYIEFFKAIQKTPEQSRPKLAFKRLLHAAILEAGLSKISQADSDDSISWTNPSTLQKYGDSQVTTTSQDVYVLPSTELPPGSWPNQQARDRVLHGLGEHFYRHFPGKETTLV